MISTSVQNKKHIRKGKSNGRVPRYPENNGMQFLSCPEKKVTKRMGDSESMG